MLDKEYTPLVDHILEVEVVNVCQQLIRLKSVNPPGDELGVVAYAAGYLQEAGLEVELVEHAPQRASLLARLPGSGKLPGLLFNAHPDTVPVGTEKWLHPPFDGELYAGKVWGRGAADMKGGLAALLVAARALAAAKYSLGGDLFIAITAGEEVDSIGAVALAERPELQSVQAIVVAEPSGNEIFVAEKGAFWLELHTYGKTAHGSMPELGRNAVMMMVALIYEINRLDIPFTPHPLLGGFTHSINTISGGVSSNVVPDHCMATVDMRTVPGQEHGAIFRQIEELVAGLSQRMPGFNASLKVTVDNPPVTTSPDEPVVQRFNEALAQVTGRHSIPQGVRYYTDAAVFVPALNIPMIICGPGEPGQAHQTDEYVEVSRLVEAARIYTLAAAHLLK